MPNVPPRPARSTIGEFDREIDELIGAVADLGRSLPAFASALSLFLDGADVTLHLYEEDEDELVLRGSTRRIVWTGESPRFPANGTVPGLAMTERRTVSLTEDARAPGGKLRAEEHVFPLADGARALGTVTAARVAEERLSPVRLDRARRGILRFAAALAKARDISWEMEVERPLPPEEQIMCKALAPERLMTGLRVEPARFGDTVQDPCNPLSKSPFASRFTPTPGVVPATSLISSR